ncbi:MAG: hypothetical protein K940chlam7_00783 [Chlamydiae bacterium]|nr:hypothetical protein [Chlamydiota bacterium]
MTYTTTSFRLGPEFTPSIIRKIIIITCSISIISALINPLFIYLFGIPGPQEWFSLSWWGMTRFLWWQPISFLFVHYGGVNLFFFIALLFNMYILWVMGSDVYNRVGQNPFLRLYFISGIGAGLITFLLMPITGQYGILSGATPSILALLVVWTLIHPEAELLLFFLIPVKAKWLTSGIIGAILLINLSNLNFVSFNLLFFGAFIGYIYALVAWGMHSPFPFVYRFELAVVRLAEKIRRLFLRLWRIRTKVGKKKKKDTVFDIKTGEPLLEDDRFIDAMLEKISKHGEQSLTWKEKQRMQEISERRKREKGEQK